MLATVIAVLPVVFSVAGVVGVVLVGRHYVRLCAQHRAHCENFEASACEAATGTGHDVADDEPGDRRADWPTEVLPRIGPPAQARPGGDPPLLTHGVLYGQTGHRHRRRPAQHRLGRTR